MFPTEEIRTLNDTCLDAGCYTDVWRKQWSFHAAVSVVVAMLLAAHYVWANYVHQGPDDTTIRWFHAPKPLRTWTG